MHVLVGFLKGSRSRRKRKKRRRRRRKKGAVKRWLRRTIAGGTLVLAGATLLVALSPTSRMWLRYVRAPQCYVVPVAGTRAADLVSTFGAPRSGGRAHRGADIFAPQGTAVLSATDGVVRRVARNKLGGRMVRIFGRGRSVYYYAHLDRWAPGLTAGTHVTAGQAIGSVGNSGNADTTPPHLHFSVHRLSLLGTRHHVDPVDLLGRAHTMPGFSLEGGVIEAGTGEPPHNGGPEWSGNPCHLPVFPHPSATP